MIVKLLHDASNTRRGKSTRHHYDDVIMTMLASQITSLTVVYSIVYSGVNQRKHQSSASLVFVREIHRGPVNFPHKWPVTRKMFSFDDVIMTVQLETWDDEIYRHNTFVSYCHSGHRLNIKTVFSRYEYSMLQIRRSRDRRFFNIGIPIMGRPHLYIEPPPRLHS